MNLVINNSPIVNFKVHPIIEKTYQKKDLSCLKFTLKKFKQQSPIKCILRNGQLLIVDGVSRYMAAIELKMESLDYILKDIKNEKLMEYRMLSNQKVKKGLIEICLEALYLKEMIGDSRGKKRDLSSIKEFINYDKIDKAAKDKYDLICALIGIKMSGSTLRKLMKVFEEDYKNNKSETGTMSRLDKGEISIDDAYKLMLSKENKINDKKSKDRAKLTLVLLNLNEGERPYKLFNKSSLNMNEVPNNSVDIVVDSHPYAFGQRTYRNQDNLSHGQEQTTEEYFGNFRAFNEEKFKKLKPGGILTTIIGESYKNGYQGICSRAELILLEIGFKIIDVIIWVKSNQKYTPHPLRFKNSYERVIICYKPGAEPYFIDVYREGSEKTFKLKKTSSGGFYMASPETCIPNVVITSAFDPRELKEIDPEFKHDAPCPTEIYKIIIEAYSKPGDTVLDGFVGSGTVGVALGMGRKVIGYDIDHESICFCLKRFDYILSQQEMDLLQEIPLAA